MMIERLSNDPRKSQRLGANYRKVVWCVVAFVVVFNGVVAIAMFGR